MSGGTIILTRGNETVSRKAYAGAKDRERIVSDWKKLYGPKFKECSLVDEPDEVPEKKASFNKPRNYGGVPFKKLHRFRGSGYKSERG